MFHIDHPFEWKTEDDFNAVEAVWREAEVKIDEYRANGLFVADEVVCAMNAFAGTLAALRRKQAESDDRLASSKAITQLANALEELRDPLLSPLLLSETARADAESALNRLRGIADRL